MNDAQLVPVYFILGQPGSGKDTRAGIVKECLGADLLRLSTVFEDYTKKLSLPKDSDDLTSLLREFENERGNLVKGDEIEARLERLDLIADKESSGREIINAFLIAYFGWYKTGLIPDGVTSDIFRTEFHNAVSRSEQGVLLTSFPYTIPQYECLVECLDRERNVKLGHIFLMESLLPEDSLKRMSLRLSCGDCGEVYAKDNPPLCQCGGQISYRRDREISEKKIEAYDEHTRPLIELLRLTHTRHIITLKSDYPVLDTTLIKHEILEKIRENI